MSDEASTWNIPVWFVRLAAGILTLAVPWAGWVTIQLTAINVRLEAVTEMRRNMERLQEQLAEHTSDGELHAAGIRSVSRRIDEIERRVERKKAD